MVGTVTAGLEIGIITEQSSHGGEDRVSSGLWELLEDGEHWEIVDGKQCIWILMDGGMVGSK